MHPSRFRYLPLLLALCSCATHQPKVAASTPAAHVVGRQTHLWTDLGLHDQRVNALAFTPWGFFAGTQRDGVLRFDSAGRRWVPTGLHRPAISSLAFLGGDRPVLLAGLRTSVIEPGEEPPVFASLDRGRTWEPQAQGQELDWPSVYGMAADPAHPGHVYLRTSHGLIVSTDAGRNWRYAPIGGARALRSLVISPSGDGRVWYGASNSLEGSRVGLSEDQGETWQHFDAPSMSMLVADPLLPDRLWGGGGSSLVRSDDAGRTWSTNGTCVGEERTVDLLQFIGRTLYVSTLGGVTASGEDDPHALLQTHDYGGTWRLIVLPPGVREVRSMVAAPDGKLVIGSNSGVWELDASLIESVSETLSCGR